MNTSTTEQVPPPPARASRLLRRSRTGRIGAGVASGLGEYFAVDPVLFRVLFATSAFFGGAGILAYLIAWAAIPEEGTQQAAVDGWLSELRRRHVPVWLIVALGGLAFWAAAFSWWLPGPFVPAVVVAVLLVVIFGRRGWQGRPADTPTPTVATPTVASDPAAPVDLTKPAPTPPSGSVLDDLKASWRRANAGSSRRRRRALVVQLSTVAVLAVTLATLGLVDSTTRIAIPVYFWTALGILVTGFAVGLALKRIPFALIPLTLAAIVGLVGLAGSHASFRDGSGTQTWRPTHVADASYRQAFGTSTLDLRGLPEQAAPGTIRVTQAAGYVRVVVPAAADVRVEANVRFGQITVNGPGDDRLVGNGGGGLHHVVEPPAGASGSRVTVDVHLADGLVRVERR